MLARSRVARLFACIVVYLLYVSWFAVQYSKIPEQFLFQTIRTEPHYRQIKQDALLILEETFHEALTQDANKERIQNLLNTTQFPKGSGRSLTTKSEVAIVEIEDYSGETINFNVAVQFGGATSSIGSSLRTKRCSVNLSTDESARWDWTYQLQIKERPNLMDGLGKLPEFGSWSCYFLEKGDTQYEIRGTGAIFYKLSKGQKDVFEDLLHPENGIARGLCLRMFYFSAVTATTLGYGDIVPLTETARNYVAAESILGLILMSFFVVFVTATPTKSSES